MAAVVHAAPHTPRTHAGAPGRVVRSLGRAVTAVLLAGAAIASVAATAAVIVLHVGFAPVLSPSMEPAFSAGDLAITRPVAVEDIHTGQVLVLPILDAPGQRYVHRVIEVRRTGDGTIVRTQGDANGSPDARALRITSSRVPVVVHTISQAGRLPMLLRGNLTLRLALLGFVALSSITAARRILTA